jgi:hypothetical protein
MYSIVWLILISWGCFTGSTLNPFFFFAISYFDWPITKKDKSMEAPQNRRLYWKIESLALWPSYISEKGRTLGKTYGIKVRWYREHRWGTQWEHEPPPIRKKQGPSWMHGKTSHRLHEIFLFKIVGQHFSPGLYFFLLKWVGWVEIA